MGSDLLSGLGDEGPALGGWVLGWRIFNLGMDLLLLLRIANGFVYNLEPLLSPAAYNDSLDP